MKRKIVLLSIACISVLILCSCGASQKAGVAAANHQMKVDVINKQYKDCLAAAQTEAEKAECERTYNDAMDEENERWNNVKSVLEEIRSCQECQIRIMEMWGYTKKEAKNVAYDLAERRNTESYSFDCSEAFSELLKKGFSDKTGTQVFAEALPKFGLSSDIAEEAIKAYYDNESYVDNRNPYNSKNTADNCIMHTRIGNNINVTKSLLIDLGLLDEEEGDDDGGEEDEGNNDVDDGQNQPKPNPTKPQPTTPTPTNPGTNDPGNNYQAESTAISKLTISKYGLGEVALSSQQQQELDAVVVFMKKWPKAKITIVGHTCNIGTQKVNQNVGERRANEAKYYLMIKGIEGLRIQTESRDYSSPVMDNDSEEHRKQNRRITFEVK